MPSSPVSWCLSLGSLTDLYSLPTPVSCQVMKKLQRRWNKAGPGQTELPTLLCVTWANPGPFLEPNELMR